MIMLVIISKEFLKKVLYCIEEYRIVNHHVMLSYLSKATKERLFIYRHETVISLRETTAGVNGENITWGNQISEGVHHAVSYKREQQQK